MTAGGRRGPTPEDATGGGPAASGEPRRALDRVAWRRVQDVFHRALTLDVAARTTFVVAECADRPELADEVLSLLAEDAREAALLDRDVADVALDVLDDSVPVLRTIGRYRVVDVLGRGGMGVVYLAERGDLRLRVAIKVLRDATLSPARRARFQSEQRVLAGLQHPRIARLYDADLLPDDTPYFVMEHVDGQALDVYCREHRLSVADRLRLFLTVCDAVRFAHGRAVIHRDLKPSNILVTEDGEPKLLDFGIAKDLHPEDADEAATRTGMRMMTPAYAAPEQLLGRPAGAYTDVYALGVILYELLAGEPPFDLTTLTPAQAERAVLETEVEPPSVRVTGASRAWTELPASAWRDLDVLCATAMHRDVDRRYRSVEALARDVAHFLDGEPLEARPDSVGYRTGKFVRRNRRALAAAAAALVGVVAVGITYTNGLAEARDQALAEAQRARRVQAFTASLFQGGDEAAGPADTMRVLTLLDRGVQEAGLLSSEPGQQAEMYLTLGTILMQLGRLDRADSLLSAAHAIRQGMDERSVASLAETQLALGRLRLEEGRYEEAEGTLQEALDLQMRARPRDELAEAAILADFGTALEGQGAFDRAVELQELAIGVYESAGEDAAAELSATIASLATTHFYAGNLEPSDSLNRRALEIDRRLHGDGHPTIADGLINLAASEGQRGRYPEAETLFREAVAIFEAYHGPDHTETASALRMLGNNLIFQGRADDARPLLERALAIQDGALPPTHPRLANTLGDLAYVYLEDGRYEESVGMYERVVDIYRASNGEHHYFVAIALSNLANALSEGGRLADAEAMFRDVVDRFTESRGADHVDTGIARIKLGRVLASSGRAEPAAVELRAGYDVLSGQMEPTVSWLRSARSALVTVYEELGHADEAERFRAEQIAVDSAAAN